MSKVFDLAVLLSSVVRILLWSPFLAFVLVLIAGVGVSRDGLVSHLSFLVVAVLFCFRC